MDLIFEPESNAGETADSPNCEPLVTEIVIHQRKGATSINGMWLLKW